MRHDAHKGGFSRGHFGGDACLQALSEQAEVIRADVIVAIVMHGEIAHHREGATITCLNRDEGKLGIFGPRLPSYRFPVSADVHVGTRTFISKRIFLKAIGP